MLKRFQISIIISIALFVTSCTNEYFEYHFPQNKENYSTWFLFDESKVRNRSFKIDFTPNKDYETKITDLISNAKKRVMMETYILTDKRIIWALVDAAKRWIQTTVILEKNVFWAWWINSKAYKTLLEAWTNIRYANNSNYRFTHAKFLIVDDSYIVWTWNMSYSAYAYNKEIFLFWSDPLDINILERIISNDFSWIKFQLCDDNIVVSPKCPRSHLSSIISGAKRQLLIYAETLEDPVILNELESKAKSWLDIKVMLWDINKIKSNNWTFERLKEHNILVEVPKKPYIHAKMIISDSDIAYVWSVNLSNNSIENNREVWMIIKNKDNIYELEKDFLNTFGK